MYVCGPCRYETDPDYEEILDSEEEGMEGELVEVQQEIIDQGKIDRNSVALLKRHKQDLIETVRQMKKEVKSNNMDTMAEILEVGKRKIVLPEHSRLPAFNAAH